MQTYTCPFCKSYFSEADKQWDTAIAFAECPDCRMALRDFPAPTNEKLQPIGAATSMRSSGEPLAPRFCSRCGAPTTVSTKFCTKCGGALNFSIGTSPKDETPSAPQPKQQEEKTATQQPYPWDTVLTWAFLAFLLGLTTARPTWKSATGIDQSVLGVFIGVAYAAITAFIVGAYKYFQRKPNHFLSSCTWTRVPAAEAKKHPLYGVGGWLALFAYGNLFGFLLEVGRINVEASKMGVSLGRFLNIDSPLTRFLGVGLAIDALSMTIILWLFFSRHQSFRQVSSCILLILWPAEAIVASLVISPDLAYALAVNFVPYVFYCTVWVPYLQRSKRVRITFEHSVKAGRDNAVSASLPPFSLKPAITRESEQERQFNNTSTERREQASPSRTSKDMSSLQPTVKTTDPISILVKPSHNTAEAHEDRLYAQIAQELDTNTVDKALWTKVYAQAGGDEKQTRVLYIKARFARLREIEDV